MAQTKRTNVAYFPVRSGSSLLFHPGEAGITAASTAEFSVSAPRNQRARLKTSPRKIIAYRTFRKLSSQFKKVNMETIFYLGVWALNFSIVGWLINSAFGG